ncbi:hypothetical protein E4U55_000452 [Claviceps digitariae]|nr:hypothetical protein E4U55_000452 [Claviceps digitariae]
MRLFRSLPLAAWALATVSAFDIPFLAGLDGTVPTPPSQDEFYSVPEDIEQAAPGSILRYRSPPVAIGALGMALNLQASYQILYRTTDSLQNATATVLTVLIPPNADLSRVLSYQVPEDSASMDCAPSYSFQLWNSGAAQGNQLTQTELLGPVQNALNQGWVVIVPDFQGPQSAFLAGAMSGNAVLDGIRAAINSHAFTGIATQPRVSLWGYSGGSLAALWAAEQQSSYAPELTGLIAGVVAGGTVPNITSVILTVNRGPFAGLIPAGVLGLANQYGFSQSLLNEHILPQYRDDFYQARHLCLVGALAHYAGKDILGMFDDRNIVFTFPLAKRVLEENELGQHVPRMPLYIYNAISDEISPIQNTDQMVDQYCAGGATVQYDRVPLTEHSLLEPFGSTKALSWLQLVMAGQSTDSFGPYKCKAG